jgi:hypothetical protein
VEGGFETASAGGRWLGGGGVGFSLGAFGGSERLSEASVGEGLGRTGESSSYGAHTKPPSLLPSAF